MRIFDLLHKIFHVPYTLRVTNDTKKGRPIIFLHGIASDSSTWEHILPLLPNDIRAITIDLLGFGISPKPKNNQYTITDHSRSVIKTLTSLKINEPIVLVGHSMGSLIAIDIAKRNPKLISSLVLVSTPFYKPEEIIMATSKYNPNKNVLSNGLFIMYEKIIENEKTSLKTAQAVMKLLPAIGSFYLTEKTWIPFKRSLSHTIMQQTSLQDLQAIAVPITLFYGKLDVLIQHKNYDEIQQSTNNIVVNSYAGAHQITKSNVKAISAEIISKRLG